MEVENTPSTAETQLTTDASQAAVAQATATESTQVASGSEIKETSMGDALKAQRERILGKNGIADKKPEQVKQDEVKKTEPQAEKPRQNGNISNEDFKRWKDKADKQRSKYVAQRNEARKENERLKQEIEALQKKITEEPKKEDFNGDDLAYNKAIARHEAGIELAKSRISDNAQRLADQQNQEWHELCESTVKDFKKFSADYSRNVQWLAQNERELMQFAEESMVGPRVIEDFMNDVLVNKEYLDAWTALSSRKKFRFLEDVESKINAESNNSAQQNAQPAAQQFTQQRSNAPAPIAPEKASLPTQGSASTMADILAKARARAISR